jgi:hypothetical protein
VTKVQVKVIESSLLTLAIGYPSWYERVVLAMSNGVRLGTKENFRSLLEIPLQAGESICAQLGSPAGNGISDIIWLWYY